MSFTDQDLGRVILNLITNAFMLPVKTKSSLAEEGTTFQNLLFEFSTEESWKYCRVSVKITAAEFHKRIARQNIQPFFTTISGTRNRFWDCP
jgi:hypothetical protein